MADDIDKKRENLKAEYDLNQLILKSAQANLIVAKSGLDIHHDLVDELQSQSSVSSKIESVNTSIDKLLLEQVKSGTDVNQKLIERLSSTKSMLEMHQKEAKLMDAQKAYLDERNKGLKDIFGITSDIEDAVLNGTFKALAMNKAFENIGASVSRMSNSVQDSMHNIGLSGASAMELQGNIEQARFSMTGLLYGSEAVAASGKAIAEKYGSASMATADLIEGVTQLSSLGLDASEATDLASVFKSAGVEATEVKGVISDIAKKEGISAKKAMEGMNGQMSQLVGKSEAQLKTIIASNAHLVKQGTSMSQIKDISKGMLDIESSMKAGAKARMILGRDMNTTAVRDASVALRNAHTDDERAAAAAKMSAEILKGVGGMEEFAKMSDLEKDAAAAAYSMSTDELATMLEKKKVNDEMVAQYGDQAEFMQGIIGGAKQAAAATADFVIELGKAAAKMVVMNLIQGKGTGLGNLNPFKKKGGGGGDITSDVANTNQGGGDVGNASQGAGGGLKSLAEGLKSMGEGKVFAGIGAVALAGPAFIVALPSIPFLLFMGKVKLKQLEENFTGLAAGLNSMSTTFMGSLAMGVFGIAAIPSILSIPFLLFMGKVSLKNLATNFIELGVGLQIMSSTFMGSLALAAFGVAALIAIPSLLFLAGIALLGGVGAAGLTALGGGLEVLGGVAATGLPFLAIALIAALGSSYDSIRICTFISNTIGRSIWKYIYRCIRSNSTNHYSSSRWAC
jgi:hypothetical protein